MPPVSSSTVLGTAARRPESRAGAAHLPANRLFAGIPAELFIDFEADVELLRFAPEEIIFEEGEPGDCLYLVYEGTVCISKLGRGQKQEVLSLIQAGDFFGEMALLDGLPRSAQAAAVEAATLGRLDHATFERILERAPRQLHLNFLRSVVERLRGVDAHYIAELMRTERLALVGTMANSIIHDLKNPLHCIRSCAELMAPREPEPAMTEFLTIINRASDNMLDMIQELLDFARGKSSIQLERRTVRCVLAELDAQLTQLVPERIQFIREGVDCAAAIMADPGRFARMLLNLIKNSIEAMPDGGLLWLRVREQDGRIIFRVSDTGCGIPADLQARIFEPFVTFGKSKGTGLGMAIAKGVVEAHGGTIKLTSEAGIGTTIEVSVPSVE